MLVIVINSETNDSWERRNCVRRRRERERGIVREEKRERDKEK